MQESTIIRLTMVTAQTHGELRVNADDFNREACDIVYRQVLTATDETTFYKSVPMEKEDFFKIGRAMGWIEAVVKTYAGWNMSGKGLSEFLQIGDVVDQDMVDYFIEVLPPACRNGSVVQIGEPYNHREGGATYSTLKKTPEGCWAYAGHCYRGKTEHVE